MRRPAARVPVELLLARRRHQPATGSHRLHVGQGRWPVCGTPAASAVAHTQRCRLRTDRLQLALGRTRAARPRGLRLRVTSLLLVNVPCAECAVGTPPETCRLPVPPVGAASPTDAGGTSTGALGAIRRGGRQTPSVVPASYPPPRPRPSAVSSCRDPMDAYRSAAVTAADPDAPQAWAFAQQAWACETRD